MKIGRVVEPTREELAGADVERDAIDRPDVAKVLGQLRQADLGCPVCTLDHQAGSLGAVPERDVWRPGARNFPPSLP
jgi:hypothetical protein